MQINARNTNRPGEAALSSFGFCYTDAMLPTRRNRPAALLAEIDQDFAEAQSYITDTTIKPTEFYRVSKVIKDLAEARQRVEEWLGEEE